MLVPREIGFVGRVSWIAPKNDGLNLEYLGCQFCFFSDCRTTAKELCKSCSHQRWLNHGKPNKGNLNHAYIAGLRSSD